MTDFHDLPPCGLCNGKGYVHDVRVTCAYQGTVLLLPVASTMECPACYGMCYLEESAFQVFLLTCKAHQERRP